MRTLILYLITGCFLGCSSGGNSGGDGDGGNHCASGAASCEGVDGGVDLSLPGQNGPAYIKASNPGADDNFGSSIALSGDTLAVGATSESSGARGVNGNQNDESARHSGAVYVYRRTATGWVQEAYLKAANSDAGDRFGYAIALSGDTLAVSSEYESSKATGVNGDAADNSADGSGAVYIFQRTGTTWVQQAYIKASNTKRLDEFGAAVALSGDTLVVGAPYEDSDARGIGGDETNSNADSSGAAYVFHRTGTTWTQQAYIKASNSDKGDLFGWAVAASGETVAVGSRNEKSRATGVNGDETNNGAYLAGAVYVFARSGTTWAQQAYVKASNTEAYDEFGDLLALSGDTLAVGAPAESSKARGIGGDQFDNTAKGSGAVYVFARNGATWMQQAYIKASNTDTGDGFGLAIALEPDRLVVGANCESSKASGIGGDQNDNSATCAGAAYRFVRSGATWTQQSYIKASNTDYRDEFGTSVAISGGTVAIGAISEASKASGVNGDSADNSLGGSGAAYIIP